MMMRYTNLCFIIIIIIIITVGEGTKQCCDLSVCLSDASSSTEVHFMAMDIAYYGTLIGTLC